MKLAQRIVLTASVVATVLMAIVLVAVERRVTERIRAEEPATVPVPSAIPRSTAQTAEAMLTGIRYDMAIAVLGVLLVGIALAPLLTRRLDSRLQGIQTEETLLTALTESLNEGVVAVDARQRIVHINNTARQLLHIEDVAPFPATVLPSDGTLRDALTSALAGTDGVSGEVRVDERSISLTARPLPDGGAVLALYDLTPVRRLETVRRDFVANVSHELRTPLTVISGFLETLQDEEVPAELRSQFLRLMDANVQRMQRIVDDLLDLSRIESGGWLPNPVDLDVASLAGEILAPLRLAAEKKGVTLHTEINPRRMDLCRPHGRPADSEQPHRERAAAHALR